MEAVPYTIFRLGPSYLTEHYPVDDSCIREEILDEKGVIGPKYYKEMRVIDSLENYDNEHFFRDRNPSLHEQFKHDLVVLAEKHHSSSAYTLLASISSGSVEQIDYMRLAADSGNFAGMVAYGQLLVLKGEREIGLDWIQRGAEAGDEMGQLFLAVSYHYGTISPLDYEKAAYWYRKLIKEKKNFYAAINLGALYMEAGYYRTALHFFEKSKRYLTDEFKKEAEYIEEDRVNNMIGNTESCKMILKSPSRLRPMMFTLQAHDSKLEAMFCHIWDENGKHVSPPPVFDNATEKVPVWIPCNKIDVKWEVMRNNIVSLWKKMTKNAYKKHKASVDEEKISTEMSKNKEYMFLTVEVEFKTRLFVPNQHELIFFERRVHGSLNQFISKNFLILDRTFREHGFFLTYLPAMVRRSDTSDIIGYYIVDVECLSKFWERMDEKRTKDVFQYWEQLKEVSQLPPDCAGFLHYNLYRSMTTGKLSFDYIMIPFSPDTNFESMFETFINQLDNIPIDRLRLARQEHRKIEMFVPTNRLEIDVDYNITLVGLGGERVEVKMPVLSRVLFIVFLNASEGIVLKRLSEKRKELLDLYQDISRRDINESSIDSLIDPTSNSVNEKISRIRRAFTDALGENAAEAELYTPKGIPGEAYRIAVPRSSVSFL